MPKSLAEFPDINIDERLSKIGTEISQFLTKCDKILFVEGPTDRKFYCLYGLHGGDKFFFTRNEYPIGDVVKRAFLNFSNKDEWKYIGEDRITRENIQRPSKDKIEILILNKILSVNENSKCKLPTHFYGIVDKDYDEIFFNEIVKEHIKVTDANSLETLLLYCAERNGKHLQFLEAYFEKRTKFSIPNKIIEQIYIKAMEFALKIGCLRKEKGGDRTKRFDFSSILEGCSKDNFGYSDYCEYEKKTFTFAFDEYCNKLLYSFANNKNNLGNNTEKIHENAEEINDIICHAGEKKEEEFNLCQGHDVVALIDVMGYKYLLKTGKIKSPDDYVSTNYGKKGAGYAFIEAFNLDWFEKSTIPEWLREKSKEAGTILSSPYQGYVIPVTGSLDR